MQQATESRSALFGHVLNVCKNASSAIAPIADQSAADAHEAFRDLRNSAHETKSRAFSLIERFPAAKHDLELVIRALDDMTIYALDAEHAAIDEVSK